MVALARRAKPACAHAHSAQTGGAEDHPRAARLDPGFVLRDSEAPMPNVETLLRDHVTLQVDCIDRLYLNGYVPLLQHPQNLWWYFVKHKGCPVPSPVL